MTEDKRISAEIKSHAGVIWVFVLFHNGSVIKRSKVLSAINY